MWIRTFPATKRSNPSHREEILKRSRGRYCRPARRVVEDVRKRGRRWHGHLR